MRRKPHPLEDKLVELGILLLGIPFVLLFHFLPDRIFSGPWEAFWIGGSVILFFLIAAPLAWLIVRQVFGRD
jgi:hypothetical protein